MASASDRPVASRQAGATRRPTCGHSPPVLTVINADPHIPEATFPSGNSSVMCAMLTLEDCLAFCGLTEDEVNAIAEHEHVPEMAAVGLAQYLSESPGGCERIRAMILDDIAEARRRHRRDHAHELIGVLRHFLETHPDVCHVPLRRRADAHPS